MDVNFYIQDGKAHPSATLGWGLGAKLTFSWHPPGKLISPHFANKEAEAGIAAAIAEAIAKAEDEAAEKAETEADEKAEQSVKSIEDAQLRETPLKFNVGDTVRVSAQIKEGEKTRRREDKKEVLKSDVKQTIVNPCLL